jgi:hypothetical protein
MYWRHILTIGSRIMWNIKCWPTLLKNGTNVYLKGLRNITKELKIEGFRAANAYESSRILSSGMDALYLGRMLNVIRRKLHLHLQHRSINRVGKQRQQVPLKRC